MRKRQREPPVYSIHRTSNLSTLIPPCPIYGTVQPSEDDCEIIILPAGIIFILRTYIYIYSN